MHELRKDENLTTAEIAGRTPAEATNPERPGGPQLVDRERTPESNAQARSERDTPLFPATELQEFRSKWDRIQTSFVDEPRQAVQQADNLVASAVKRLAEQFAEQRSELEGQWGQGSDISTEDLRQALRRYRSFFDRLLSA